jgi:antirestriction protein
MLYSQIKRAIKESDVDTVRDILNKKNGEELLEAGIDAGINLADFDEAYQGEYSSNEDFVQELVESCGDIPKNLPSYIYIDWERTARDVMMDYSEANGHYFRNL